jgi:hypothetical protein
MKTRQTLTISSAIAAVLLAGGTLGALAQTSIGVNFVNSNTGSNDNANAGSLSPAETAGAPGYVQANWNNLSQQGAGVTLTNSAGSPSSLYINWSAGWTSSWGTSGSGSDGKLMDGSLGGNTTIVDYTALTSYTNVSAMPWNAKPMVYVSGLDSWFSSQGAEGYAIVVYESASTWWDTDQSWIESVTGSPINNTMQAGPDLTPHLYNVLNTPFGSTYLKIPATATSNSTRSQSGNNYGVFTALTNDAVLIRTGDTNETWGNGAMNGFQIIPIFPTLPTAGTPTFSPSSTVYAGVPVTLTEVATGDPVHPELWYQWRRDTNSDSFVTNLIADATNSTYSFTPANAASPYTINFDVIVTNIFGASTSLVVTLNVNPAVPPYTTTDTSPGQGNGSTNVYAFANGSVTFSAAFAGSLPITNLWQVDKGSGYNAVYPNATNGSVTVTNLQSTDNGNYRMLAGNVYGTTPSTPSPLTVLADPAAPTAGEPYAYTVFNNNPAGYWRFSETINVTTNSMQAYDYSGHNLNATYGHGVAILDNGLETPAFPGFNSGNQSVSLQNGTDGSSLTVPSLNLNTNTVTISMWINPNSVVGTYWGLFMWANGSDKAGFGFGNTQSNSIAALGYTWNTNSPATYNFNSGLYPPAEQWSFVSLVITPTNSTIYLYYVNGSVTNLSKAVQTITNSPESFNGGTIWIGMDGYSGRIFDGYIDEVSVFNRSLSEVEIQNLFGVGSGVTDVAPYITSDTSANPTNSSNYFPGQVPVQLTAAGAGAPPPVYQWQAGSGGVFTNLANSGAFSGVNSGTMTINPVMPANYLDYRLLLTNINGSATSSVYAVSQAVVPNNGLWTARFQVTPTQWGQAAASGMFTGLGVLGSGTYWNSVSAYGWGGSGTFSSVTSYQDDGSTDSRISCTMQGNSNASSGPYATNDVRGLLSQVIGVTGTNYTTNSIVLSKMANGNYNMAFHGACGGWNDRGATFLVHGINGDQTAGTINGPQFALFENVATTVLFTNVQVTNGTLNVDVAPTPIVPSHNPNNEGYYNAVEVQLVSYSTPTAGFSASETNVFVNHWFAFNDQSSTVTNVVWNFGDGGDYSTINGTVYHGYAVPGTYSVSQTVTGPGGTDSVTKTAYINVFAQPAIGTVAMSGGSFVLSGTGGISGQQYRILTSTNVALPLASWTPAWTNVFALDGSYNYTNSSPTNGASFFIMVTP